MGFINFIAELLKDPRTAIASWIAAGPLMAYGCVFLIIFIETGVVFFPFLPGDSLLFASGFFAHNGGFNIVALLATAWAAAILGDQCNFMIGHFFGRKIIASGKVKAMTPEQFVLGIIRDCNARALFCGENFTFGAKAAGTPELLRQLCAPLGVEVVVLPMAQFEEKPVSSTRIRTALEGGDIPAANAMLGMPYAIRFTVHHGAGLGRTLGVPTINQIYPQGFQLPRYGIYITRTRIGDRWYPSATGLGTRPTVNSDESKVTCETFIPGFTGDLYGTDPVVEFHAYLSPSKKFDTLDELRECIDHAAQRAQEYFAE